MFFGLQLTVLVLDFTELGDVSKLLLGGVGTENLFAAGKVWINKYVYA